MKLFKRIKSWFGEWEKTWTVKEDFGGDKIVHTPYGDFRIPADFEYNKASWVFNTIYEEIWKAFALHDFLYQFGYAYDINGDKVWLSRKQADICMLYIMIQGSQDIMHKLLKYGEDRNYVGKVFVRLIKRSLIYYRGVRLTIWNNIGWKKEAR